MNVLLRGVKLSVTLVKMLDSTSVRRNWMIRVWDFLGLLFVVLPLLTGGIWISRRPHFFIEISELAVPVLILSVFAVGIERYSPVSVTSGRLFAVLRRVAVFFNSMGGILTGAAMTACVWTAVSWTRHWNLGSHAFDLGIYTHGMWRFTHGADYSTSLKGMHLFADHVEPLALIVAPLFALIPRVETLLIFQAVALASGSVALYFLTRQYWNGDRGTRWVLGAIPVLYWLNPGIRGVNAFDYHPEIMMLPLYLWSAVGIQSRSLVFRVLGIAAFGLALGAKESSGPVAVGLGLAWILGAGPEATRSWTRKWGWACLVFGVSAFYIDLRLIPPLFGAKENPYVGLYGDYKNPIAQFQRFFGPARLKYLFLTLGPLGFLPLLNRRAIVAALPGYAMLFLSEGDHRLNLHYHYAIEPSVGLFFALPGALLSASSLLGSRQRRLKIWILFCAMAFFGRSELFKIRRSYEEGAYARRLKSEVLPCIAPQISLATGSALIPQLLARPEIFLLTEANQAGCVVIDHQLDNWPLTGNKAAELASQLSSNGYRLEWSCGSMRVYSTGSGEGCMVCKPRC